MRARIVVLATLAAVAVFAAGGCGDEDSDQAATAPPEAPPAERLLREAENLAGDLAAVGVALLQGGEAAERARAELPRLRDRARNLTVAAADRVAGDEEVQRELARVSDDIAATVESLIALAEGADRDAVERTAEEARELLDEATRDAEALQERIPDLPEIRGG